MSEGGAAGSAREGDRRSSSHGGAAVGAPSADATRLARAGDGRRGETAPILLLHGFFQGPGSWGEVVRLLGALLPGRRILAPDLREDLAAGLDSCADALAGSLGEPVFVVGYSMGGRIALSLARRHPQLVRGLILESAGLGPRDAGERAAYRQRNEAMAARFRSCSSVDEAIAWWEGLSLFVSQRALPEAARVGQRASRRSWSLDELARAVVAVGAEGMPLEADALALLAAVPFPTWYVAGEKDEKYALVADRAARAGLEVRRFPTGHCVHLEAPEAFAEAVAEFVS